MDRTPPRIREAIIKEVKEPEEEEEERDNEEKATESEKETPQPPVKKKVHLCNDNQSKLYVCVFNIGVFTKLFDGPDFSCDEQLMCWGCIV